MEKDIWFSESGDFLHLNRKFCLGYPKWNAHNLKYYFWFMSISAGSRGDPGGRVQFSHLC